MGIFEFRVIEYIECIDFHPRNRFIILFQKKIYKLKWFQNNFMEMYYLVKCMHY